MRITPIHPIDTLEASPTVTDRGAPITASPRILGTTHPSRRTLGTTHPSRRTLGVQHP
jgi:hypothetical protein